MEKEAAAGGQTALQTTVTCLALWLQHFKPQLLVWLLHFTHTTMLLLLIKMAQVRKELLVCNKLP